MRRDCFIAAVEVQSRSVLLLHGNLGVLVCRSDGSPMCPTETSVQHFVMLPRLPSVDQHEGDDAAAQSSHLKTAV